VQKKSVHAASLCVRKCILGWLKLKNPLLGISSNMTVSAMLYFRLWPTLLWTFFHCTWSLVDILWGYFACPKNQHFSMHASQTHFSHKFWNSPLLNFNDLKNYKNSTVPLKEVTIRSPLTLFIFCVVQQPNSGLDRLIVEVSRSHAYIHTWWDSSVWVISSLQKLLTSQHTTNRREPVIPASGRKPMPYGLRGHRDWRWH